MHQMESEIERDFGEPTFAPKKITLPFGVIVEYMTRPSKYTPELTKRVHQYIADGLTVRDACYGVGISEDTFCRWRREKPEFAKLVQEATEAQCWSSAGLARTSEYRRYQRRVKRVQKQVLSKKQSKTYLGTEKAQETPPNAFIRHSSQTTSIPGSFGAAKKLMERNEPLVNDFGELICCAPYYNCTTNKVEWVERETYGKPVLHRCSVEKWREMTG